MKKVPMALSIIMLLTLSAGSFASDNSLKGSSLRTKEDNSGNRAQAGQQRPIEDMRTMSGGSLGGAEAGEIQAEEERPVRSCKEAFERCRQSEKLAIP